MGGYAMKTVITSKKSSPNADETFATALRLADVGQLKVAFAMFLEGAQHGDAMFQNQVGLCFDIGEGVKKDANQALHWYKRAWKSGSDTSTCMNIAGLYASMGNRRQCVYWWRKAIELGDGDAALELADYLAAEQSRGWETQVANLVECTKESTHITQDAAERAATWFRNADAVPKPA